MLSFNNEDEFWVNDSELSYCLLSLKYLGAHTCEAIISIEYSVNHVIEIGFLSILQFEFSHSKQQVSEADTLSLRIKSLYRLNDFTSK